MAAPLLEEVLLPAAPPPLRALLPLLVPLVVRLGNKNVTEKSPLILVKKDPHRLPAER